MALDGKQIRSTLLQVVSEQYSMAARSSVPHSLQQVSILVEAQRRLGGKLTDAEGQALLTAWYDLFRSGQLSWGHNLNNPDPPFCHITEKGRGTLAHLSRDPANPDGYLEHLAKTVNLNPVAQSYVEEALSTFGANCFRATAVMIGAAAESLALGLRDAIVVAMQSAGKKPSRDLEDWKIKRVLDAIQREVAGQKAAMPPARVEAFESYWPAFTQQIRAVRNESGHPTSTAAVTEESVHAALLIFPELAVLAENMIAWISKNYR